MISTIPSMKFKPGDLALFKIPDLNDVSPEFVKYHNTVVEVERVGTWMGGDRLYYFLKGIGSCWSENRLTPISKYGNVTK